MAGRGVGRDGAQPPAPGDQSPVTRVLTMAGVSLVPKAPFATAVCGSRKFRQVHIRASAPGLLGVVGGRAADRLDRDQPAAWRARIWAVPIDLPRSTTAPTICPEESCRRCGAVRCRAVRSGLESEPHRPT
ncbi:hypothetical protein FRAAL2375 [Frankia alni ACN14a]|uniref:Uncharacterized protein n=1 Tax=Frankia alni (strain DSM 45986 / CECT 9034 / ACN14a) TaxID=326424 RepID=Q0RN67_FRAAA|nr:hypothetical protein FRAAL2375 [Frankia alni ACN14a]